MKNSIQEGQTFTAAAPSGGVVAGRPYVFGDIIGVAAADAAVGVVTVFETQQSIYRFAKFASEAWTIGQKVYWDTTNFRFTTTVGSNLLIGNAAAAALSADTTGLVKMRAHMA
jgi:predicted RecA/RadA family phage recombinase